MLYCHCNHKSNLVDYNMGGRSSLLGLGCRWVIVLFVLTYVGKNITGVNSISRFRSHRHALKSIQSEDGDIIDCIEIYKQPAFDHPALKKHTIQMAPSSAEKMEIEAVSRKSMYKRDSSLIQASQLWRKNGSCPTGTIPIRRICGNDFLNCNLAERYGRKGPSFPYHLKKPNENGDSYFLEVNRTLAILITDGLNYNGAKADIKVWTPHVEHDDEYSTSRIALKTGPYYSYESIESGWAVNPSVYGDRETRIYTYWTVDGSNITGCFDLICPGFVQTSNEVALGGVIRSIPVPGGLPWIMTLHVVKDPETKNWWLRYQENTTIGYWPAELFEGLSVTAETVQWGGEVYSSRLGHPGHTSTEMGSGELPDYVHETSGWTKRMRIQDNSMVLKFPDWVSTYIDDYACYNVFLHWEYVADPAFFFGGPGKDWHSWHVQVDSISRPCMDLRKRMKYSKRHAVKTFQSEDGDTIDCLDIYKQPAFDHPALRNHKVQMNPNYVKSMEKEALSENSTRKEERSMIITSQIWRRNGSCPTGTIPIWRISKKVLLNCKSSNNYGRKSPSFPVYFKEPNENGGSNFLQENHTLAILVTQGYNYNGAKADVRVYNPYVEHDDEYSTSRIALKNGPRDGYESIESGWAVNPSVYGDRKTRLYTYWTVDGSQTTGCFDLTCPGFVQTSNEIALGGVIRSIPVPGGLQWVMTLHIFKDPETTNWWVQYQENTNIGYWPSEIFERLTLTAETVQWGGEVYSSRVGHPGHTATAMGGGPFPDLVSQVSGWTKRMRIQDNSMLLKYPEWVYRYIDDYRCYNGKLNWEFVTDPEFYFGGPGRCDYCP